MATSLETGNYLARLRNKARMTQNDLAKKTHRQCCCSIPHGDWRKSYRR